MPIDDGSEWNAVIVGAGPAGALCACLLARRGWRVLLLEKSKWPREKVCGGCVNAAAMGVLGDLGLADVLAGGMPLDRFHLHVGQKSLEVRLPEGIALSRLQLDARLVHAAQNAGAHFVPEASARLEPSAPDVASRRVKVMHQGRQISLNAQLVLACDGIGGTLLESEPWAAWRVARDAWFGVSAMVDAPELAERGAISMFVGRGGYAGAVVMPPEAGTPKSIHVAAALAPKACRAVGGPAEVVARITGASLKDVRFQGTGLLTRQRLRLGGHRVLAVGDACGYVEPFTGEGIAWAMRGAHQVVQVLPEHPGDWNETIVRSWERHHARAVRTHWCRALRHVVHRPAAASIGIALASAWPAIARGIGDRISGLPHLQGVGT